MSVFSKEYCEKMRVRIDCGNMLAEAVGEHGITAEEIEQLRGVGARVVTMGPRILRTETAGMAALSAILTLTGDL